MALVEFQNNTAPYLNAENLNNNFNYLDEKTQDIYSTNEIVIGKWIDGKPIYRKVLNLTSPSILNTNVSIANLTSLNIESLIKLEGFLKGADGRNLSINSPEPDYTITTTFINDTIEMKIEAVNWQQKNCIIIIEYTKTTDEGDE